MRSTCSGVVISKSRDSEDGKESSRLRPSVTSASRSGNGSRSKATTDPCLLVDAVRLRPVPLRRFAEMANSARTQASQVIACPPYHSVPFGSRLSLACCLLVDFAARSEERHKRKLRQNASEDLGSKNA